MILNREEKTLLFIVKTLDSLIEKGLVPKEIWKNGDRLETGSKKEVDRILKGFKPTDEEYLSCMKCFTEEYLDPSIMPKIPFS